MEKKEARVVPGVFRSLLGDGVLVCSVLAAICGGPGVVLLFSGEYRQFLLEKMISGGITSASAVATWHCIGTVITVLAFLCPVLLAAGLASARLGQPARGFGFLSSAARWMLRATDAGAVVLAAVFLIRAVWYIVDCLGSPQAVMNLYSMVISEGLMGVLAWFLYRNLRRFLDGAEGAAASIAYTLSSGRIDDVSIPGSAERGFLILAILCILWAVNQSVTVTIVPDHIQPYYSLILPSHPGEWLAVGTLALNGVTSALCCAWLRRYNRICERAKFEARKQK